MRIHSIIQYGGMSLARVELRVVLRELFAEFPTLRPTRTVAELPYRDDMFVYGLKELPVTW